MNYLTKTDHFYNLQSTLVVKKMNLCDALEKIENNRQKK